MKSPPVSAGKIQRHISARAYATSELDPTAHSPYQPVFTLQRTSGNRATNSLIQAKLAIGSPDDHYEQEADRVARLIVASRSPTALLRQWACSDALEPEVDCAECGEKQPLLRRRSRNLPEPSSAPPIVHEVLRSPGQPLDPATRAFMESRFDHDFSQVRVHTDAKAAESSRAVHALAYTVGQDVVFGAGRYAPGTMVGNRLLAHELTHTLQGAYLNGQIPFAVAARDSAWEREAAVAERGGPLGQIGRGSTGGKPLLFRDTEAAEGWSYAAIKQKAYRGLIGALKTAHRKSFQGVRSLIGNAPASIRRLLNIITDVFEIITDLLIQVILAIVGMAVGFGEGIFDMIWGLIQLVYGILKWFALLIVAILDDPAQFNQFNKEIAEAASNLGPALKRVVKDWLDRFQKASPDEGTVMIGELTGQILSLIATFGFAAAKAGQVPTLTVTVVRPVQTAGRALAFETATVVVDVASPAAAAGIVESKAMAIAGGPGGGSLPPGKGAEPPKARPSEPVKKPPSEEPSKPTSPEASLGFTAKQIEALKRFLGKAFDQVPELKGVWDKTARTDHAKIVATNTNTAPAALRQIRYYFGLHRNRFWTAVKNDPKISKLFTDAGFKFGESGRPPRFTTSKGERISLDIDHRVEIQQQSNLALTPSNLRIVFPRENRVVLRLLHQLDPFLTSQ